MLAPPARSGNYFQFPLRMLSHGKPITEVTWDEARWRTEDIKRYCLWDVGLTMLNSPDEEKRTKFREIADREYGKHYDYEEGEQSSWTEEVLWVGAAVLNLIPGSPRNPEIYSEVHDTWRSKPFGRQLVRMAAEFVDDARDGLISWREFATLAGIYGAIGDNSCLNLTVARINAMSLGYSGMEECRKHQASGDLLTDRQIRRTVDTLYRRGFFVRVSPDNRHVFYSHRLSQQGLFDEIVAREVRKKQRIQVNQTEAMRAKVLEQLKTLSQSGKDAVAKR